jgi:streptomycin 6-kinase
MFDEYLRRWELTPDGDPITTQTSRLLPVRRHGSAAILKIAIEAEEKRGGRLMTWWGGGGAARVLAHDNDTLLLERATGTASLVHLARTGHDDEASRIICGVVAKLHRPRTAPRPELVPLTEWFADLAPAAEKHGGILAESATAARDVLGTPRDVVVLHGDIHHGNILDFGERAFDYANIFCNPDHATATSPGRLVRQLDVIARAASLERARLLKWILAFTGLSAAWSRNDSLRRNTDLEVAKRAAELGS